MADDEQRDEVLRRKLSLLRWVREEHLDIKPTDFNEQYIRNAADGTLPPSLVRSERVR